MVGIYFSGTGNTKHCVSEFLKCGESDVTVFSIEDKDVVESIKSNDVIVFGIHIAKKEYNHALLGGYRIVTLIGFLCGTIYQFVLLKNIAFLFASMVEVSEIKFNFVVFWLRLHLLSLFMKSLCYFINAKSQKSLCVKSYNQRSSINERDM